MKRLIVIGMLVLLLGCAKESTLYPQASVEEYLNQLLDYMEQNHVNRKSIDWPTLRAAVQQKGKSASRIYEADESIILAFELLNDKTSFLLKTNGQALTYTTACEDTAPPEVTVPADIGYIKIPAFSNTGVSAAIFAEKMHGEIKDQDRADLKGWIVDLRENTGGNMWPMIAGIGPILGEGTTGFFIDSDEAEKSMAYVNGASTYNDVPVVAVSFPHTLLSPNAKVAILMSHSTINAGEAVAVAFSGKADTRSFGAATCGRSGGNQAYQLSDGAVLYLTIAFLTDRNHIEKRGELIPDELITDPTLIFDRAVDWINQ